MLLEVIERAYWIYASLLFFVLSIILNVVATVKEKGRRSFVFGVSCAFAVWTFWAMLVAQMAISR